MTPGLYSRLCAEKEKHLRGGGNTLQYRVIPYTILQYHLIQYNTIQYKHLRVEAENREMTFSPLLDLHHTKLYPPQHDICCFSIMSFVGRHIHHSNMPNLVGLAFPHNSEVGTVSITRTYISYPRLLFLANLTF